MTRTVTLRHDATGKTVTLVVKFTDALLARLFPGWTLIAGTVLRGRRSATIAK